MGHLFSNLAASEETAGALCVAEVTMRPGMEPPPHVHRREAELLFILDGTLEGFCGDTPICARPGELVVLPKDKPHGWRVSAGKDGISARALLILVPGATGEYFRRQSIPAAALTLPDMGDNQYAKKMQQDLPQMIADAAEFEIEWMPPGYAPTLQAAPAEPKPALNVLGETFQPLAASWETGGALTAILWTSPDESLVPRHVHHESDEAFYILEGEAAVTVGDDFCVIARPGDFVFLPKNIPHSHRSHNGKPARALQLLTPGGIEGGLAEVAALLPQELTPQAVGEIAGRYNLSLLPESESHA